MQSNTRTWVYTVIIFIVASALFYWGFGWLKGRENKPVRQGNTVPGVFQ